MLPQHGQSEEGSLPRAGGPILPAYQPMKGGGAMATAKKKTTAKKTTAKKTTQKKSAAKKTTTKKKK